MSSKILPPPPSPHIAPPTAAGSQAPGRTHRVRARTAAGAAAQPGEVHEPAARDEAEPHDAVEPARAQGTSPQDRSHARPGMPLPPAPQQGRGVHAGASGRPPRLGPPMDQAHLLELAARAPAARLAAASALIESWGRTL